RRRADIRSECRSGPRELRYQGARGPEPLVPGLGAGERPHRDLPPESFVSPCLLKRFVELAHSGSRTRADRTRSERADAPTSRVRRKMSGSATDSIANPAAAAEAASMVQRRGVMFQLLRLRRAATRGRSPSSK